MEQWPRVACVPEGYDGRGGTDVIRVGGMDPEDRAKLPDCFLVNFFKCSFFFFLRETDKTKHEQGRGRQRGRHRI